MLSLAIAAWSAYVVVECLCRWFDGRSGCTGVYDFPRDSVFHHRNTCSRAAEDTDGGR